MASCALVRKVAEKSMRHWDKQAEAGDLQEPDEASMLLEAQVQKPHMRILEQDEAPPKPGRLAAFCEGYSLECRPNVAPHDRAGLERLLRYGARPAFSQERLEITPSGKVSYRLAKPFYTGQTHVVLPPEDFVRRLAALIPRPRQNLTRYHGILAPNAKHRPQLLKLVPKDQALVAQAVPSFPVGYFPNESDPKQSSPARYRHRWADLLRRVFAHDLWQCPCGARRKIIGVLSRAQSPQALAAFLSALGEPTQPPLITPARAPPQTNFGFAEESLDQDAFLDPASQVPDSEPPE